ncbi:MAG TPA: arginase family protein, partial [Woeseiaceae bacterium]
MSVKKSGDFAFNRQSLYGTTSEPTYAGALSFMRRKYTRDLDGVDLAVTGIPLDTATTNRPGARLGPRAIRAASSMISWERPYGMSFDPFDRLAVIDYGDCFFDFGRPETVPAAIEAHAAEILSAGTGVLSLGGDHFVSWPLLRAHAEKHG